MLLALLFNLLRLRSQYCCLLGQLLSLHGQALQIWAEWCEWLNLNSVSGCWNCCSLCWCTSGFCWLVLLL